MIMIAFKRKYLVFFSCLVSTITEGNIRLITCDISKHKVLEEMKEKEKKKKSMLSHNAT